jgi:nitroreductase
MTMAVEGIGDGQMDFAEILRSRKMTRHFTDEPLKDDVIDRIVGAGLRAPSAGYSQGTSMLVLRSNEARQRLWKSHSEGDHSWSSSVAAGVSAAPLVIVVLTSKCTYLDRYAEPDKGWTDRDEGRWPAPYWYVDAGCVVMLLLLAAIDEGLGALFFGMLSEDLSRFRQTFGVPAAIDFVGCVAIGHPDPDAPRRDLRARRREVEELVHRERW